jgi:hypothetical protein
LDDVARGAIPRVVRGSILHVARHHRSSTLWWRIASEEGLTAINHSFVIDEPSVWLDILGGLLIAGALAAWVPHTFP